VAVVPEPFECAVCPDREVVVVALSGELDIVTAPEAARTIGELLEAGFSKVTVDLTALTFIESTGLRMLLKASQAAAERGCRFTLVQGPDAVDRVFVLTNLHSHFTFEPRPSAISTGPRLVAVPWDEPPRPTPQEAA
jgi:anti-sigma B factor antagonist